MLIFDEAGFDASGNWDHYSMLLSIEDLFGLPHLGMAGVSALRRFDTDVFTVNLYH